MKIFLIILAVVVVAIITAVGCRAGGRKIRSFLDAVRNPERLSGFAKLNKEIEDTAAALSKSPKRTANLVDFFVFEAESEDSAWGEKKILARLGEKAYPRALEILRDKSLRDKLVVLKETKSLPEAPINRLCAIFDMAAPPPPEAAALLAPFLESDSKEIKKSAVLIIGSIGAAESIPLLRKALADKEEPVRYYALTGINRAISGKRITSSVAVDQLFDMVAAMWPEDTTSYTCNPLPEILLRLDHERGVNRLLQDDVFSVKFACVDDVLAALNEEKVQVPRPRLLVLLAEVKQTPLEYPMDRVLKSLLTLLGDHANVEDLPVLESYLDHANDSVAEGAIQGLYRYHRFPDKVRDRWQFSRNAGWNALTPVEKYLCEVELLDGEVNNGGFAQYYFNSAGNGWRDALDGLAAMGAVEHHKIMKETLAKFPNGTPSSSRDERMTQLSKVAQKKEDPFKEQDAAWYDQKKEKLSLLMFKYDIKNTEGRSKAECPAIAK